MRLPSSAEGVVVAAVRPRTAAAAAGLVAGDRIMAINAQPLRDAIDFQFYGSDDRLELSVEPSHPPRFPSRPRQLGVLVGLWVSGRKGRH